MVSLPHPYPAVEAERYLYEQNSLRGQALGTAFAIVTKGEYGFCGVVELREIEPDYSQAEQSRLLELCTIPVHFLIVRPDQ